MRAFEEATSPPVRLLLCGIGLALLGPIALGELAVRRRYGGEMPVGGLI